MQEQKTQKQLKAEQRAELLKGLRDQLPYGAIVYGVQYGGTYRLFAAPVETPGRIVDITYRAAKAAGYRISTTGRVSPGGGGYNKLGAVVADLQSPCTAAVRHYGTNGYSRIRTPTGDSLTGQGNRYPAPYAVPFQEVITNVRTHTAQDVRARLLLNMPKHGGSKQDPQSWKVRHLQAMAAPTAEEKPIVQMFLAWADYADQHRHRFDSGIGDDGVLGPQWAAIGAALRGLLDGPTGTRLDCGTLSSFVNDTLTAEDFNPEE